jgi:hypothetical protein
VCGGAADGGRPELVAINRHGDAVRQHTISSDTFPGEEESRVGAFLEGLLAHNDSEPARAALKPGR